MSYFAIIHQKKTYKSTNIICDYEESRVAGPFRSQKKAWQFVTKNHNTKNDMMCSYPVVFKQNRNLDKKNWQKNLGKRDLHTTYVKKKTVVWFGKSK